MATPGSPEDLVMKILCGGTGVGNVLTLGVGLVVAMNKKSAPIGYVIVGISAAQLAAQFVLKQCGDVDFWSKS